MKTDAALRLSCSQAQRKLYSTCSKGRKIFEGWSNCLTQAKDSFYLMAAIRLCANGLSHEGNGSPLAKYTSLAVSENWMKTKARTMQLLAIRSKRCSNDEVNLSDRRSHPAAVKVDVPPTPTTCITTCMHQLMLTDKQQAGRSPSVFSGNWDWMHMVGNANILI